MSGDLREGLKRAAAELDAASPSPSMDAKLRARLEGPHSRRAWLLIPVVAAAAAAAFFIFSAKPLLGGFEVLHPTDDFHGVADADQTIHITQGAVALDDRQEGLHLEVTAPITLRRERPGARIVLGSARIAVEHRQPGQSPLRVLVSHGAIEVLGTHFTVVQEDDKGHVTLHDGSIRFVSTDGRVRLVKPGETLDWPLPAEAAVIPAPTPAPEPEPAPVPAANPAPRPHHVIVAQAPAPIHYVDADDLLRQVDVLRSRGEFAEAVRYLTHGLTRELKPGTRERFSFELGIILTDQMHDSARACAHWKKHSATFGDGRYGVEVSRASARAGCGDSK